MINWLKRHWSHLALIVVIIFLLTRNSANYSSISSGGSGNYKSISSEIGIADGISLPLADNSYSRQPAVAPTESDNRLIIQDTSLSLQVTDVGNIIKKIEEITASNGGFLVNYRLSKPELAASGSIVVRVPETKRAETLTSFKNLAVKVVSESVIGNDVTDQYVDLQTRLEILTKTKTKFEEILAKAYQINDLLNVQRELISLQSQIDDLKGQQKYLEQTAKLSKITVYLSTDELALPYAPTNEWRPTVIFKTAIRSLLSSLRIIAGLIIWLVVYSPIIIPVLLIIRFIRRRLRR